MLFAESDFLGDFCFWGFFFLLLMGVGIAQAIGHAANAAKNIVQNKTVQEAGKSIFAAWLEDVFKKR